MKDKRVIELPKALVEGYVLEKECKASGTSGAIYLPKGNIGKKFKVLLLPMKDESDELESYVRKNHPEIVQEFLDSKKIEEVPEEVPEVVEENPIDNQQPEVIACQGVEESTEDTSPYEVAPGYPEDGTSGEYSTADIYK